MFHLRVAVLFVVLMRCTIRSTNIPGKEITAYPSKVHQMYTEQHFKSDKLKKEGVWSSWSPWTPCSRSCGGGVTQQIRHCIPVRDSNSNDRENWRLKLKKRNTKKHCIGIYKRFHLCNPQRCPIERDFRVEQCSYFNRYSFKGKLYYWEPFLQGGDECALNCRPLGLRFYATLNKTVIDGTSCLHPLSATGKAAPGGTKGVCVNGRCKSVAGNGVIGAIDELPEECSACSKGLCKSISGIYTKPDLPLGYSLVAQIPEGACKINVQQLQHTKNYIALRNANGSFIVNGDWKFSPSATIEAAGTRFFYKRNDPNVLETVTALGPLINPVDLMIVYQQPNIGIKYGYMLPMTTSTSMEKIAPPYLKRPKYDVIEPRRLDLPMNSQKDEARVPSYHRKRSKRRFSWKAIGVTPCSKSCGGGMQTKKYSCVREHTHTVVSEKRCTHVEHPPEQDFQCNLEACPPNWKGTWSQCTGSCGQGVQHFIQRCQQEISNRVVMLSDSACTQPKLTVENRPCELPKCETETDNELHQVSSSNRHIVEYEDWQVGPWAQCSVSCGTGQRTRSVTCLSGRCSYEKRPPHAEYCESGSCATNRNTSSWLVSEWSQCSESCGTGSQLRLSVCGKTECDVSLKPETTRSCSSDRYCVGQWFTGPWGSCSESCHELSKQHRDVMCIIKVRGQSRVTNDMTCSISEKPPTERLCQSDCPPRWFVGEWSICEGNCPAGAQRREVKCMEKSGSLSSFCKEDDKPLVKRPCKCDKHDDQINIPAHDEPQDYNCVDKFSNCYLAVKARLCHYDYYVNNCCVSCRKVQQDLKQ